LALLSAMPSEELYRPRKNQCGLMEKIDQIKCCKARREKYKINVGVCKDLVSRNGLKIVGFNPDPINDDYVSEIDSYSDAHASDDNPGKDEGICHVYKVKLPKSAYQGEGYHNKACIPGNIMKVVENTSEWIESTTEILNCSFDLEQGCNEKPNSDTAYNFAVKFDVIMDTDEVSLRELLKGHTVLSEDYGCDIEQINGAWYMVCPL